MSVDQNLPAILGYLSTMFYNPNNVAFEASPFTTLLELKVGDQLCEMLGYRTSDEEDQEDTRPVGWGHITCDGTVANLESIWYALRFWSFLNALVTLLLQGLYVDLSYQCSPANGPSFVGVC